MSAPSAGLEIRVTLVDGKVVRFHQGDDDAIRRTLAQAHPERLFAEPHLFVSDKHSMTGFARSAVVRVDFVAAEVPSWPFPGRVTDIREVSDEDFLSHFHRADDGVMIPDLDTMEDRPFAGVCEVFLAGDQRVLVRVRAQASSRIDQRRVLPQLFRSHSLHFARLGQGVSFLNPDNISHFVFYPRPPETPLNAWPARRLPA